MNHTIQHGLDLSTSRRVLEKAAESYIARFADYSPAFHWDDDTHGIVSFKAMGMTAKGIFTLKDGAMDVSMDVPFVLKPFRTKALDAVESEVKKWVAKSKAGEL
jgi:hypothetical protein